ncbi:MAG TPA: DUF4062 domain-containing protein [Longimicrobiaceae bacterium]|nr:DUF4062 domain-containing protein [Longimicrobiaceae bacterium]
MREVAGPRPIPCFGAASSPLPVLPMAKFYLSSTYADLQGYRSEVYQTLRRMGHDAVAMEDYVAADERPLARCLADVARCDAYIGIVAWRRGFVPDHGNPGRRSVTELEYARAGACRLPRLLFLLSPAAPWPSDAKDPPANEARRHLSVEGFRERLGKDHLVSYFETPHQLALLVSIAVRKWEIESGYTSPVPSLSDQRLPNELGVESYIPGRELKVTYDEPLSAKVFAWAFMAVWFLPLLSIIFASLFPRLVPFVEPPGPRSVAGLALFAAFGGWLMLRKSTIRFDLEEGRVTVEGKGGFSTAPPSVGALTLVVEERQQGWRSSVRYGGFELLRTSCFPTREEARERVLNFAVALNFQLGMHTLKEEVKSRRARRHAPRERSAVVDGSHRVSCFLGAATVLVPVYGYLGGKALLHGEDPPGLRIGLFAWGMLPMLLLTLGAAVFGQAMLQRLRKEARTRARAFTLGLAAAGGILLFVYLAS